jgi:hypothetical protein
MKPFISNNSKDNVICLPGGWAIEILESWKPYDNFIERDLFSMFRDLGKDLIMGHTNHESQEPKPFYLLDRKSGDRIRIYPPGTYEALPEEKADYMNNGGWTGTLDRGDGEADLEYDPPQCPDRKLRGKQCGGDAYYGNTENIDDPDGLIRCSDCDGVWDRHGDPIEKNEEEESFQSQINPEPIL